MDKIERQRLRDEAYALKLRYRGPEVFFRGLIEISNRCRKNCLYCGIRGGNQLVDRYEMSDKEVLREAQFALDAGYGSIALQGGERTDSAFVERIARLVRGMRHLRPGRAGEPGAVPNDLGITLSLGEQSREVYREWKEAGASRYLLRIEASNRELYEKLHPGHRFATGCGSGTGAGPADDGNCCREENLHSYDRRVQALVDLKGEGYLLGSGIMIGLPFQTYANLDEDLRFLKEMEVDMVGMGPYIPHSDTPLGKIVEAWRCVPDVLGAADIPGAADVADASGGFASLPESLRRLASLPRGDFWNMDNEELLELCIDMVARLRIMMPHINIAATTALQVLHPNGREMALMAGANVIMPNMTETSLRGSYSLYEGKQGVADDAASTRDKLLDNLASLGIPVGWNNKGDWR